MVYYQFDALLQDNNKQEHVSYVLKTATHFRGKDITQCIAFQKEYLKTVFKFDNIVLAKLTEISEAQAAGIMNRNGLSMKSIPSVEFAENGTGLAV